MCSGCLNESLRQKRVLQIEKEILSNTSTNDTWIPLLDWIYTPITLTSLCQLLQHISIYKVRKRDDHIYGAMRYLANSLGISICNVNSSDLIDQPMTSVEKKQVWCSATFHCRCINNTDTRHTFHVRTFCKTCSFLMQDNNESTFSSICPFCLAIHVWHANLLPSYIEIHFM
jgi:hypothetical protein